MTTPSLRNLCLAVTLGALVASGGSCGEEEKKVIPPATEVKPSGIDWENLEAVPNGNGEASPQPTRLNPYDIAISSDGRVGIVALRGSEVEPSQQVAILDVAAGEVRARLEVGARPVAVAIHPHGDVAVVLSQFSPLAAVIDLEAAEVTSTLRVGYYAQDLVFDTTGGRLYVADRAGDSVLRLGLTKKGNRLLEGSSETAPAGSNPEAIALSPDGNKVYVADSGSLGVRVLNSNTLEQQAFIHLNAPVFDVAAMGDWMVATTLNGSSGLPCEDDGDYIGTQGDGIYPMVTDETCSRGFADIQNELAFIDPANDTLAVRYTSDSAEVSEADRENDHDPNLMRVRGALPQVVAVAAADRAYVTMGASDELVELLLPGSDPAAMEMPRSFPTGFAPRGVAVDSAGSVALVADKLGETVTVIDLVDESSHRINVGNNSPVFPATSAEIGELFAHSAKFSTDGDQSCVHCHPDNTTDGKGWGVAIVRAFGRRATLPMRNLHDTKPLLVEGVFDEGDFRLEMEGISFRADFHDSSYTLQVERRDQFYLEVSNELIGRPVSFNEMVAHVGNFLVVEPRLLPSPFDKSTPEVERGESLFERPDVGCAGCHPAPSFASENLFEGVATLGRYDLPRRDLDPDVSIKFLEQARDGFFNANSLRGMWDRPGALLHDGRARTLRETILTPDHSCVDVEGGERAFNEFHGQVDTNGGISHLTCEQIDDLVAFIMTLD
jgi:DNA-binding beta-propeller fold protein YncE